MKPKKKHKGPAHRALLERIFVSISPRFVLSGTGKLQTTKKTKNLCLADRGLTCDFLRERSVGFLQSFLLAPPVWAELANWSPLAHSSWVKCGFPTGRPEGCILSAKTETEPY